MKQTKAYGVWSSPISVQDVTSQSLRLAETQIDPISGDVYWLEGRPQERGRNTIMRRDKAGNISEVLAKPINCRSRCHEYGGGNYLVHNNIVYFALDDDQRIYQLNIGELNPQALTPIHGEIDKAYRFADFCIDESGQRLIAVMEDHSQVDHEPSNRIVSIPLDGSQTLHTLIEGDDFYSNPRLSPNGKQLSWLSWNHPDMPWDATSCWVAQLDSEGSIKQSHLVAGGDNKGESIFQPQWSPSNELYLVSDRSEWWNIYRVNGLELQPICPLDAEFATPQWVFGMSCFGFLNAETILCCFSQNGQWQLASVDVNTQSLNRLDLETEHKTEHYSDIASISCFQGQALFLAASAQSSTQVLRVEFSSEHKPQPEVLASSSPVKLSDKQISKAQAMQWPSPLRSEDKAAQRQAYGFYYPPCNETYSGLADERPPLIVISHGGPTGACESSFSIKLQFWTSRGFAVLDVNYTGSTGYGRPYRDKLKGQWGIYDVEDVCAGAEYLVQQGLADPERLIIRGSSAGGYTVLAALTFKNTFKLGCSLYGIGNLETLAQDTHKFEARYCDTLIAPYPEQAELYRQRSPIKHIEQLNCPVIFLQGLEDKVVPPDQAQSMVDALQAKGIPVAYLAFEGEGHGFRQATTIERSLEAELAFYTEQFKIPNADSST